MSDKEKPKYVFFDTRCSFKERLIILFICYPSLICAIGFSVWADSKVWTFICVLLLMLGFINKIKSMGEKQVNRFYCKQDLLKYVEALKD